MADEIDPEFKALLEAVRAEVYKHGLLLEQFGSTLGRPTMDALKRSRHKTMEKIKFNAQR